MRTIRWMHCLYIVSLLVLDTIINAIFGTFGFTSIVFVSNLHFLGLLLLTQNDSPVESIIKAGILGIWMDLNHIGSFPIFFAAYTLSIAVIRFWDRYIGTSTFEFIVIGVIGLFIKEMIIFILLPFVKGINLPVLEFIANRTLWIIIGNILLLPIVIKLYRHMHRMIMQRAQNLYMR